MKILVIGNGFDLYHKLPTRYSDFLTLMKYWDEFYESYQDKRNDSFDMSSFSKTPITPRIDKQYLKGLGKFRHLFESKHILQLNEFVNSENAWLKYFIDCSYNKGQWIDFERDMEIAITDIKEDFKDEHRGELYPLDFIKNFSEYGTIEYHSEAIQPIVLRNLKSELDDFIYAMRLYFLEFIDKAEVNIYSKMIAKIPFDAIISFNYTHTFEKIYSVHKDIPVHNIHGDTIQNNMVLGIKDENNIDNRFVYFKKYFQRIQKRTGLRYKQWVNDDGAIGTANQIYVIGHSVDNTDGDFFREIINSRRTSQVTFFYHNQQAYEQQVINLIEVLTKDKFLKHYYDKKIIFTELESPDTIA